MKYSLVLIVDEQTPEGWPTYVPVGSFHTEARDFALEDRLKASLFATLAKEANPADLVALGAPSDYRPNKQPGRPPKPLLVSAMTDEANVHTSIRLGKAYTSPELSHLLGFDYNRVSQIMSTARAKRREQLNNETDPVERAKIEMYPVTGENNGVSFHYLDETPGVDKID